MFLKKQFSKSIPVLVTLVALVVAVVAFFWLWNYYMLQPWTRDGRVRANVIYFSPEVSGRIISMDLKDNQKVSKGQLLFEIDPADYQHTLTNAIANQFKAKANMGEKKIEMDRYLNMAKNLVSQQTRDQSTLEYQSAVAQYRSAEAAVAQAKLNLKRTKVYSPVNGYIDNLNRYLGDYVTTGSPILTVIDSDSFYVYGYFLETQIPAINLGANASIMLLGHPKNPLKGKVVSIARGIQDYSESSTGVGLANVNPTFDWVRLAMRIPVHIKLTEIPENIILSAGMTATVVIE